MDETSEVGGGSTGIATEAVVRSGGIETRYHRAGAGAAGGRRAVLLLAEGAFPTSPADRLLEGLAPWFRVIRPDPPLVDPDTAPAAPAAAPSTTAWIRGVVDGLGLGSCALVAEGSLCLAAAWLAFSDPERATHLVLLVPEVADPMAPGEDVSAILANTGQPVMLLRMDPADPSACCGGEVLERVARFLLPTSSNNRSGGTPDPV